MQLQGTIAGRIIRDPEMSYTPDGIAITKFTMPSNVYDKKKKQDEQETQWINCTAFGKQAETINNLCHKGTIAMVTGRLNIRTYQDRNKATRVSIDLAVSGIEYLTDFGKAKNGTSGFADEDALEDIDENLFKS